MNHHMKVISVTALAALFAGVICLAEQPGAQSSAGPQATQSQPTDSGPSQKECNAALETQPATPSGWPPGPLHEWLSHTGAKPFFDQTGVRVWGFVETGFTGRLTGGQNPLPGRLLDARRVNSLRLNQLRLTVDRPYDSAKTFDIGGRADALYGGDAFFTHALGLDRMGEGTGENWFDAEEFYLQPWLKTGKESGAEFTVGRYFTPFGVEAVDAALSPLYSHSYLFNQMGPFTVTGAQAKYIFNPQYSAYFGVVNGWDDFHDNNQAHSYMTGGGWNSAEQVNGHSRATGSLNVMTGPEQRGNVSNFRTVVDGVFTYWWNDKLSQTFQADWATEEKASQDGGVARWYGTAHYLSYIFNDKLTGVWRSEWFRDDTGVRTGTPSASWYEMTWGVTITPFPKDKILKNLSFRPEFRWDFADQPVFGGGRQNQLTAGIDAIFKF